MKSLLLFAALALLLPSCVTKSIPDQLMGKNEAQSTFSEGISDHLQDISRGRPYTETSPYIPYGIIPGGSPACISNYTGHARRYDYDYHPRKILIIPVGKKVHHHFTVRELAFMDGTGCWQGPNPPLGFYEHRGSAKVTIW